MRTLRRPAALAVGMTLAAALVVTDLPSGPSSADAVSFLRAKLPTLPPPPPPPPPPPAPPQPAAESLAALRQCESGGNYAIATGNGYYGAYQFSPEAWRSLGYGGLPHQAPPHVQDQAASALWSRSGWAPWPGCSRKLRLR